MFNYISVRSSIVLAIIVALSGLMIASSSQAAIGHGDLVMCDGSQAVYYIGEDNNRYVFPNKEIFFTWYPGFDDISHITCEELSTYSLAGVVKYRSGVRLVKIPSVPIVYAVSTDGLLRPIQSEEQAIQLYGVEWADLVDDLNEAFFPRYSVGAALTDDELPEGMLIEEEDGGLSQIDDDGEAVEIGGVLTQEQKNFLLEHAQGRSSLEVRLGKAISRITELESEIERLQRALERLQTVKVYVDNSRTTDDSSSATPGDTNDDDSSNEGSDDSTSGQASDDDDQSGGVAGVTDLPDLTVSSITLNGSAISANLANIGTADSGDTSIYFWLDGVLEWTYSSTTLADSSFLLMGDSSTISPQNIVGERSVKVCVDPFNTITELSDSNNCLTETLDTGDDGDFEITQTWLSSVNMLGGPDETLRSFGFYTSAPIDHYTITIHESGNVHDQLIQQIIGSTNDTSFVAMPSWLTPLSYDTTYSYTIHAEEYGTGDAADFTDTFTTTSAPTETTLLITVEGPADNDLQLGGTEMEILELLFTATGGEVELDNQGVCFNGTYTFTRDDYGESFSEVILTFPGLGYDSVGTLVAGSGADCYEFDDDVTLPEGSTVGNVNVSLVAGENLAVGDSMFAEYQIGDTYFTAYGDGGAELDSSQISPSQHPQGVPYYLE